MSTIESALKVLKVLEALSGYAVTGVSNTALAKALGTSPASITHAIDTITEMGWVRKDEASGHFHPTPRMGQVFMRVLSDIAKAEQQVADLKTSFTRN